MCGVIDSLELDRNESSKNLRAVQELLGHANVTSTQIYTKLDYQFLSEVYDKSHPRAKKK